MKNFLVFIGMFLSIGSFAGEPREIDKSVVLLFQSSFPKAQQVQWHELKEFYAVNFVEAGIRSHLIYRRDGSFVRLVRYYTVEYLPFHVQFNIAREYPGKKIFGVTEFTSISENNKYVILRYYVKLETDTHWLTLRVDGDGNSTLIDKFKKI